MKKISKIIVEFTDGSFREVESPFEAIFLEEASKINRKLLGVYDDGELYDIAKYAVKVIQFEKDNWSSPAIPLEMLTGFLFNTWPEIIDYEIKPEEFIALVHNDLPGKVENEEE
jgi:hypothetical protein